MQTSISPPELVTFNWLAILSYFYQSVSGVIFKTGENEKQENEVWI